MTTDTLQRADLPAYAAPADVGRLQRLGLVTAGAGAVLCLLGLFLSPAYFFRAWLVGWVFWMGVALGCQAIFMLHHMTRGAWGLVVRRVLEAASRTLPLLLILFLPIALGMRELYEWARPGAMADPILAHKAPYLNVTAFLIRQAAYFLIWGFFAWRLNSMSLRQDRAEDPELTRRMQLVSAFGIVGYCLALTFAAVDWLMSLQPHWYSTIYGIYLLGSQGLSALGFLVVFALYLSRREPMAGVLQPRHFHDWGKLLLAFVMLWAYFSFSQFLIIWAGNLPEEIPFYLRRFDGGWGFFSLVLAFGHFVLPFCLLLSRDLKRRPHMLARVAWFIIAIRLVDLIWLVAPNFNPNTGGFMPVTLANIGVPLALAGVWLVLFAQQLGKLPLVPVNDPYFKTMLLQGHEGGH
jgi:hypothetical protein